MEEFGDDIKALWKWRGEGIFRGSLPWRDGEPEKMGDEEPCPEAS